MKRRLLIALFLTSCSADTPEPQPLAAAPVASIAQAVVTDVWAEHMRQQIGGPSAVDYPNSFQERALPSSATFVVFASAVEASQVPNFCIQRRISGRLGNDKLGKEDRHYFLVGNNTSEEAPRVRGAELASACATVNWRSDGIHLSSPTTEITAELGWVGSGLINAVNSRRASYLGFDLRRIRQNGISIDVEEFDGALTIGPEWNLGRWSGDEVRRVEVIECISLCDLREAFGSEAGIAKSCPADRCLAAEIEIGRCGGPVSKIWMLLQDLPAPNAQKWRLLDAAAFSTICDL